MIIYISFLKEATSHYFLSSLTLSLLNLAKSKLRPNFQISFCKIFKKQIASYACVSTGRELSFEWSHHTIWSADSKVRIHTKQIAPCVHTGRELLFEWLHRRISSTDSKDSKSPLTKRHQALCAQLFEDRLALNLGLNLTLACEQAFGRTVPLLAILFLQTFEPVYRLI